MTIVQKGIMISKLDAARRQLATAITLWFEDRDPVSIHTLVFAAYEIIHAVSKQRNPARRDLLFNSQLIEDEHRVEYVKFVKEHGNFFKHALNDGNAVIEFRPVLSQMFFLMAILGVELCGEQKNAEESAFMWWQYIDKPDWLTESGRKLLEDTVPSENVAYLRTRPKSEFLQAFKIVHRAR